MAEGAGDGWGCDWVGSTNLSNKEPRCLSSENHASGIFFWLFLLSARIYCVHLITKTFGTI